LVGTVGQRGAMYDWGLFGDKRDLEGPQGDEITERTAG